MRVVEILNLEEDERKVRIAGDECRRKNAQTVSNLFMGSKLPILSHHSKGMLILYAHINFILNMLLKGSCMYFRKIEEQERARLLCNPDEVKNGKVLGSSIASLLIAAKFPTTTRCSRRGIQFNIPFLPC